MKIIYLDKHNIDKELNQAHGGVFALGDFDGVHKGHVKLFDEAKKLSSQLNNNNVWGVITFSPNTKLYFSNKFPNYEILTTDNHKLDLLKKLKVPLVIVVDFENIHKLSAYEFISLYLVKLLKIKGLVTGSYTKLGSDLSVLKDELHLNNKYNIQYKEVDLLVSLEGKICSSSLIKELLRSGNIKKANSLLWKPYAVTEEVIHGKKLGHTLGYPTANLSLHFQSKPKHGIYATRIFLESGKCYDSVSSFGVRPTIVNSNYEELLETHIFNFSENLYGQQVKVEFVDYIREERKFDSMQELVSNIESDILIAKNILKKTNKDRG